jgi:4-amino-4-deoxy-L-arabinose transferase-like glycosyltransferase
MSKNKTLYILAVLLFLFFLALRIVHLTADPPATLSMSAGPYGDPGGYSHNARNKALFGQWVLDELNPMYHTLIPHFMTYLSFKLFGVGIIQMNLVPLFFCCLLLILVALMVKRMFNSSMALIAFSFLGINYLFIMFSRIANRVMPMIFFLVLSLFFLQKGLREKKWYFLAGFSCLLAFITKGVCFYILPTFFLGFIVFLAFNFKLKKALLQASYFISGFLLALIIWIIFVYIPYGHVLRSISEINIQFLIPPKSIQRMLEHFWTRPSILFKNMPILSWLSSISFLTLLYRLIHKPKTIKLLEWIMIFWFAVGFIYFALIYQRVTRHFIPQIVPMVFLSIILIHEFLQSGRIIRPRRLKLLFGFALLFWLFFPVSKLYKLALPKLPEFLSNIWTATTLLVVLSALTALLVFLMIKFWPKNLEISLSSPFKKATVLIILLGVIFLNGQKYLSWALHPQFKIKLISKDLGKAFDHATIAGLWAPVICLENKHRAYESYPGLFNDEKDFLEKYEITHVFASTFFGGLENKYYWRNFPKAMEKTKLLAKYFIWRGTVLLYELNPPPEHSDVENHYEAEIFTEPQGMPRYAPDSSGKFAVFAEKNKPGLIVSASSPGKISEGKYKVLFRIKKEENSSKPYSRIARIDAVSQATKRVLKRENLYEKNFSPDKNYQEFTLTIFLKRPSKVDFRVYSDGKVSFWVDKIRVIKSL